MGLRFRKTLGSKHVKLNIGLKGVNSTSFRVMKGITYNSKYGLTLGIPGTGISYNFGKNKTKNISNDKKIININSAPQTDNSSNKEDLKAVYRQKLEDSKNGIYVKKEYNVGFKKFTGGYNNKSVIAIIISFILCITPLWPLGLLLAVPSLLWFIISTLIKINKYNKHLKK